MARIWAMQAGEALTQDVEYLLSLLVSATGHLKVLEGGPEAEEFVEGFRMDVQGLVDELKETLTLNADLLGRTVFVDVNAPVPLADMPEAERLPETDG